jgi:aryl-alcohol dehydrogenase-like predicted oxidoreductase/enamine deaminase RidA (YjgF/YER057c/UK114 family)
MRPPRYRLAPDLEISRLVTGLWQVADMERGGHLLDPQLASTAMLEYWRAGFDSFDMADHYGSAELISGRLLARVREAGASGAAEPRLFTKWCPQPGPMTRDIVRAGVERSRARLGVDAIDLLQFHWWSFEHPSYLDAVQELAQLKHEGLIRHIGLTNFDTAHLRLLVKHGIPIATNQVCFSLLDRRAAREMSAFCAESGVRLLAYGTLAGGLLSERWLGQPEPAADTIVDWSKMKYKRFIDAIGGWPVLQTLLGALQGVARRHRVSIANVATRWVLEHEAVAAVIVGARLGEREHRADNLALFCFSLDDLDRAEIDAALASARMLEGDCGDEYRKPPFLTASGDLSHHLESLPRAFAATAAAGRPSRLQVSTGSMWERACGYSRAVRIRDRVLVSGTTATNGAGQVVCAADAAGQTVFILDKIAASLAALGARLEDVVRTRIYLQDAEQWQSVAHIHGRYFAHIQPANTLVEVSRLIGDYAVEIEAEAIVESDGETTGAQPGDLPGDVSRNTPGDASGAGP